MTEIAKLGCYSQLCHCHRDAGRVCAGLSSPLLTSVEDTEPEVPKIFLCLHRNSVSYIASTWNSLQAPSTAVHSHRPRPQGWQDSKQRTETLYSFPLPSGKDFRIPPDKPISVSNISLIWFNFFFLILSFSICQVLLAQILLFQRLKTFGSWDVVSAMKKLGL